MPVIALVGNKGGAGKTTLAVNLASALMIRAPTIMLDADPQGSTQAWRAFSDQETNLDVLEAENDIGKQIASLEPQYQYIVVDCPPSVHAPQTSKVLRECNIALIPVQPSPVDLWATVHVERALEEAQQFNPAIRAIMVVNQLEPRTTLSRLVREALAEIELPVAETAIRRRAIYRTSALEGKSVHDMGKRGAEATAEIEQLLEEVILR